MKRSKIAVLGFTLAVLMPLVAVLSPIGYRLGVLDLRPAMYMVVAALAGAGLALFFCVVGAFVSRPGTRLKGFRLSIVGVVFSGILLIALYGPAKSARTAPPIHDITTDTEDPPVFVDLLEIRKSSPNGPDYDRPRNESVQRAAYPKVKTLLLKKNPAQAFEDALRAVKNLGWEIAGSDKSAGRIEATQTSFWFGFKDDVVIRILANEGGGSRVDLRSKSRMGISDLGVNARRIENFLIEMTQSE